ncbi:KilA-N domain-containing protein [Oceanicaulis sp.]|uniref:KilA-N domain-containing protein n=1 Tax=Oceanicaulis sp. TaxID=1924941 RepID=UPI003D2D6243
MPNQPNPVNRGDLTYNGCSIREKGEMLSLTDMWKAAGGPDGRAPADWRVLASSVEFANHVAEILNAGKSGNELFKVTRGGRRPGTFAHWQVAIAYAKYLNHDFHMWCNQVVRERMEGSASGQSILPAELSDQIERIFGISRMLSHKVTEIEKRVNDLSSPDPAVSQAIGFKTSTQVLTEFGFQMGEIRGRAGNLTQRLRRFCMTRGHRMRMTAERRLYLFDCDAIHDWIENAGGRDWLIAKLVEVRSAREGQGHLRLVGRRG